MSAETRTRLEKLSESIEDHALYNADIVDDYTNGEGKLAMQIGGDEASISCWAAELRQIIDGEPIKP